MNAERRPQQKAASIRQRLTRRTIEAIPAPTDGSRTVVLDSDVKGFSIRVTAGAKVFYLVRKVNRQTQRVRIGAYP
ncbi:MAG: hypothetical protein ACKOES_15120, partial [Planctomycetaceae bacterium]